MGIDDAIKKLETSNKGLKVIMENLDEQLTDIRLDPRLKGLVDDLENLDRKSTLCSPHSSRPGIETRRRKTTRLDAWAARMG